MDILNRSELELWEKQINEDYKAAFSVDCVIFGYDESELKILLIKSDMPHFKNLLSVPGDLVKPNTELDEAAQSVLLKRTGLENVFMEQVSTFSSLNRHPLGRVITVAYYSLLEINSYCTVDFENREPRWVSIDKVGKLAFDHNMILEKCLQRLKFRLKESPIGFELLPDKFTLKQLQNLYEVVLGITLDKRNFRRKLNSLDILIDLDELQKKVNHRPAKLYRFDKEKYNNRKQQGIFMNL